VDDNTVGAAVMVIAGGIGFVMGRTSGRSSALDAMSRYLRGHQNPAEGLSEEQREQFQSWWANLREYVRENYKRN
jgi:hypothetical protein